MEWKEGRKERGRVQRAVRSSRPKDRIKKEGEV
jgi:hypothetical protein